MTTHNDSEYTREDWFIDEDDCVPVWRIILSWIAAAGLVGVILAMAFCK